MWTAIIVCVFFICHGLFQNLVRLLYNKVEAGACSSKFVVSLEVSMAGLWFSGGSFFHLNSATASLPASLPPCLPGYGNCQPEPV
jgi:hypothetical protein